MNVCVFCSSSLQLSPQHVEAATVLGTWLGRRGHTLLWGGCNVGLMNVLGEAATAAGGRTIAVVPAFLEARGLAFEAADELLLTRDLSERKALLRERADAFVALPGGVGTWEELLEVLALKKLRQLEAPIVIANLNGCYDPLLEQFQRSFEDHLNPPELRELFIVAESPQAILAALETGQHGQSA